MSKDYVTPQDLIQAVVQHKKENSPGYDPLTLWFAERVTLEVLGVTDWLCQENRRALKKYEHRVFAEKDDLFRHMQRTRESLLTQEENFRRLRERLCGRDNLTGGVQQETLTTTSGTPGEENVDGCSFGFAADDETCNAEAGISPV